MESTFVIANLGELMQKTTLEKFSRVVCTVLSAAGPTKVDGYDEAWQIAAGIIRAALTQIAQEGATSSDAGPLRWATPETLEQAARVIASGLQPEDVAAFYTECGLVQPALN